MPYTNTACMNVFLSKFSKKYADHYNPIEMIWYELREKGFRNEVLIVSLIVCATLFSLSLTIMLGLLPLLIKIGSG